MTRLGVVLPLLVLLASIVRPGVWWDDWGIGHVRKYSLTREPTETDPKAGGVRAPPPAFLPWDTPWPQ